jgi:hypothetical protein
MAKSDGGLPPLYARWMDAALDDGIPTENTATCSSCAMCATDDDPAPPDHRFDPQVKCCTYQPVIPNFLVGRVLADDSPDAAKGRDTVVARIAAGIAVTPLGLGKTKPYALVYEHGEDLFGRALAMRCPHYVESTGGTCGIWRSRNAVCATWFCKHDRGAIGRRFWHALLDTLAFVENALALWCALEAGIEATALQQMRLDQTRSQTKVSTSDLDASGLQQRALWGRWLGREHELFADAATRVDALAWADVERIAGVEVAARLAALRSYQRALLDNRLPLRLRSRAYRVIGGTRDEVRVETYSRFDSLGMPRVVLEVLPHFDGVTTDEALAALPEAAGVELDRELLARLVDFELLGPDDD